MIAERVRVQPFVPAARPVLFHRPPVDESMSAKADDTDPEHLLELANLALPPRAVARGDRSIAARRRPSIRRRPRRTISSATRTIRRDRLDRRARGVRVGACVCNPTIGAPQRHRRDLDRLGRPDGRDGGVPESARGAAPVIRARGAMVGGAIIVAWIVGLGLLVRREYFRPQLERLAEAALRVSPARCIYGVMQGDRQVGFASSHDRHASITMISSATYLVADIADRRQSAPHRRRARTSRCPARCACGASRSRSTPTAATGARRRRRRWRHGARVRDRRPAAQKPDSQRVALTGPVLLPTLVPLAVALTRRRGSARHYVLPVFDPAT